MLNNSNHHLNYIMNLRIVFSYNSLYPIFFHIHTYKNYHQFLFIFYLYHQFLKRLVQMLDYHHHHYYPILMLLILHLIQYLYFYLYLSEYLMLNLYSYYHQSMMFINYLKHRYSIHLMLWMLSLLLMYQFMFIKSYSFNLLYQFMFIIVN